MICVRNFCICLCFFWINFSFATELSKSDHQEKNWVCIYFPNEIWQLIFKYLPKESKQYRLVSCQLNTVFYCYAKSLNINMQKIDDTTTDFFTQSRTLSKLIPHYNYGAKSIAFDLLRMLTKLKILKIYGIEDINCHFLKDLSNLEELVLHRYNKSSMDLTTILCSLTQLKKLKMSKNGFTTDKNIMRLSQLQKLENVSINMYEENTYHEQLNSKYAQLLKTLPKLKKLHLVNLHYNESLQQFCELTTLESLKINCYLDKLINERLHYFTNLQNLTFLKLDRTRYISNAGLSHLSKLTNLKVLIVTKPDHKSDNCWTYTFTDLKKLYF